MSHYGEYCNAHFGEFSSLFCMALFHYFYGLKREYIERFIKTWWSFIFNNKVTAGACVLGGPFVDSKHWCGSGSLFSNWWGYGSRSCSSPKWCKAATTSLQTLHDSTVFRVPLLHCEHPQSSISLFWASTAPEFFENDAYLQIRVRLLTLIRNRNQLLNDADPDPQHWGEVLVTVVTFLEVY